MDSLAKRAVTKPLAWFMLILMPVTAGIALYIIFSEVLIFLSPRGPAVVSYIRTITPLANILLPGINPYVPIVYGWLAIVIAVVFHEASHGIVARSLGMRVKSAGVLLLLVIPIGAFVEIDEKELRETRARNSLRVLAAGSGINFIVAAVCFVLLIFTVSSMVPATNGAAIVGVTQDAVGLPSPALHGGIKIGDFIVAVNGTHVNNLGSYPFKPFEVVDLTVWRDGHTMTLPPIKLGETIVENIQTHQNTTSPYLGVSYIPYQSLQGIVSRYATLYTTQPIGYMVPPSFPNVAGSIPFSDTLSMFYTSSLGASTAVIANLLFWIFFVNFNLSIFNNLPIYPLDGGQAFQRFLVGAGRGRINEDIAGRIALAVTLILAFILFATIAGPYLSAYF